MKTRKRRIIRSLELDEVSAVGKPAMEGARVKITRSAPEPAPARPSLSKPLLSPELIAEIRKTEQLLKQQESSTMTNDVTKDYETLTKHYADKWDVTPAAAGARLMRDRPDLVEKAYNAEQARYVAGIEASHKASYGA